MRLVLLGLLLISFSARAANVVTSDVTNQGVVKKWHILADISHNPAGRDDQFASTDFTFFLDYQLNKDHSFRILQAPTKYYDLAEGQNEWSASDTILYHFWNTGKMVGPMRIRWVTSANIPTSEEAQDNRKITTITGTLQANTLIRGKLMVSVRPYLRYNWYEFKTSAPATEFESNNGGNPLPALNYGLNLISSYQATSKFSLNLTLGYSITYFNASQFDESRFGMTANDHAGRYLAQISGNYEWTDKMATYLAFTQGDSYIRDGRYEMYAYDPVMSRTSLGLTFYF